MPLTFDERLQQVKKVTPLYDYPVDLLEGDMAELFFRLVEQEMMNQFSDVFKDEIKLYPIYRTALRLSMRMHCNVSFGVFAFLILSGRCETFGDVSLYLYAFKVYLKRSQKFKFNLEDYATLFKGGVPSRESLQSAWEGQRLSDGTNALDYVVAYGL
ncbi:hypothetical protein [Ewingella americana]|uniref:Uncharacterized protein n=1 Tax=Ewingella americana TaxID=41202 RepID=A0A502GGF8_9GAMM|nr:hypothetical protein [Ewingella americana]TPG60046.1 hypothetical protein EAH77_15885 [Ewingella americana]